MKKQAAAAKADDAAKKLHDLGRAAERRKDYWQAFKHYENASGRYPGSTHGRQAAERLAALKADKALMNQINKDAAAKQIKRLMARARSWQANGRTDLAIKDYKKVVEIAPDSEEARIAKYNLKKLSG